MTIKIKKIESYYLITKIKEHKEIKKELLSLIDKMPPSAYENISKTDWNIPSDYKREYLDLFYKIITPYMREIQELLKEKSWEIKNTWFQQYYENDCHEWHRHAKTNFGNTFYLELPDNSMTTTIRPLLNSKQTYKIKAEEGDLLTFPAFMSHTSEKIKSNSRKTIIAFNSDFM